MLWIMLGRRLDMLSGLVSLNIPSLFTMDWVHDLEKEVRERR